MAYKNSKNMLQSANTYNKYYGEFRGVDFSSDPSQIADNRFAYVVNMYKDYLGEQGHAIETVPGYRRAFSLNISGKMNGIHSIKIDNTVHVMVHLGNSLYRWNDFPMSVAPRDVYVQLGVGVTIGALTKYTVKIPSVAIACLSIIRQNGETFMVSNGISCDPKSPYIYIESSELSEGDVLKISYLETTASLINDGLNDKKSISFVFNNLLYIIDGKNYWIYDGETLINAINQAYVPTTYINIIPGGENANVGTEYEQRNLLSPQFKHTYVGDGITTEYYLNEPNAEIVSVEMYGEEVSREDGSVVNWAYNNGKITFAEAPAKPKDKNYPEGYAGITITASCAITSVNGVGINIDNVENIISECSIVAIHDNRVFLSGNKNYPNHIFWCGINSTGYVDPTYFGVLNCMQDGVENDAPITGMIPVADTLMVLKADTQRDGSVYFHSRYETGKDVAPVVYPSTRGLNGIGCLGACTNFLDDPVFISRLGLEAIGQLSVRYERAIEHRSSLIDAKLVNSDLSKATLEEWNGYLILLVDGQIFMADSRQKYAHETGVYQYEWFYLNEIGVWKNQYLEFSYARYIPDELKAITVTDADGTTYTIELAEEAMQGEVVNAPDEQGYPNFEVNVTYLKDFELGGITYKCIPVFYAIKDGRAYLCETKENYTGGTFNKATQIKNVDGVLMFSTDNGDICVFNFDKRDMNTGRIHSSWYTFDGRIIFSGCATKMDCCGIPHLTKSTISKSTVIKTKNFDRSSFRLKVQTNRKTYNDIAKVSNSLFSFEDVDFTEFTFYTTERSLFGVKEKEKRWMEKQYFMYSDDFMKPFGVLYIAYRYKVHGRFKD